MMKKIGFILILLTAWSGFSQEDTVRIPESTARLIALDLVELDHLRATKVLTDLELSAMDSRIENLSLQNNIQSQQLQLQRRISESYRVELEAERLKKKPDNTWNWILRMIGAAATGFVIGSIVN